MNVGFLRKCSITYLLLPNLLFCSGWFRQPYAFLLIAGLCFLFLKEIKKHDKSVLLSVKDIGFLLIFSLIWIFLCGINGYSSQSFDWLAHQVKFYDLYKNDWPIYFPEVDRFACYYFGYYLVPSFISKMYGQLLPVIFAFWTAIGFFLGLAWVYILIKKSKILLLFFMLMRGTGQLVILILNWLHLTHLKVPIFNPSVRSIFDQSTFAPNQIIPALIGSGILLYDFLNRRKIEETFFIITLLFVWGVFPALSLTAVFAVLMMHQYVVKSGGRQLGTGKLFDNYLLPGLLFIPVFIYFLSSQKIALQGFIWEFATEKIVWLSFFSGIMVDILLFCLAAMVLNKKEKYFPEWFILISLCGLLMLSVYRIGIYNDLFFRGSIPICVILFICILRGAGVHFENRLWPKQLLFYPAGLLLLCLMLGVLFVVSNLLRDNMLANQFLGERNTYKVYRFDAYPNTYQALMHGYKDSVGANQYLGAEKSFYKSYFSKLPRGKATNDK